MAFMMDSSCEEIGRFEICKLMGWDYHTFNLQPISFINEIKCYLNTVNSPDMMKSKEIWKKGKEIKWLQKQ